MKLMVKWKGRGGEKSVLKLYEYTFDLEGGRKVHMVIEQMGW